MYQSLSLGQNISYENILLQTVCQTVGSEQAEGLEGFCCCCSPVSPKFRTFSVFVVQKYHSIIVAICFSWLECLAGQSSSA